MTPRPRELTPDRSVRHLFGSEMRRLREQAGMSLEDLAAVIRYSRSSLHRYETAQAMIAPDLAAKLDAAFGTDGLFAKLYALARNEVHPDKYRRRMELEARAVTIEEYSGHTVPGLVQTEAYARELLRQGNPESTPADIGEKVAARMGRQSLLQGAARPYLSVILDEGVLRRTIGAPEVMRAQLEALLPLVDSPVGIIQVLPFRHRAHALLGGSLTLLTLDNGTSVAYEESITTGQLLEDAASVARHRRAYDVMRANALSPRETGALIASPMEALST
ncbi:helix-turn-helix transcriptional regulator [Streptomyces sp. NBC_01317]|uniref:helix-turn-helix domain-containing protein n=1 Tax=Streptomyces sp. NBC_01317 TaxID=2903822 RepID=UPI002E15375D|nr:helix-turn-helix transcriptional regulator [Streptomyces sp. NBC_01317]